MAAILNEGTLTESSAPPAISRSVRISAAGLDFVPDLSSCSPSTSVRFASQHRRASLGDVLSLGSIGIGMIALQSWTAERIPPSRLEIRSKKHFPFSPVNEVGRLSSTPCEALDRCSGAFDALSDRSD